MMLPHFRRSFARGGRTGGFSVIEALVAFGLAAFLAVLLLGALNTARDRAKTAGCIANLRQIGACIQLYLGEHRQSFPPTPNANQVLVGGAKGTYSGYDRDPSTRPLNLYVNEDYRIFRCPADVGFRNNPAREALQPEFRRKTHFEVFGTSYRYNARDMGKGSLTKVRLANGAEMYRLPEIKTPSHFIVMGCMDVFSRKIDSTGIPWNSDWHGVRKAPAGPGDPISTVLFADWHVEVLPISDRPTVYRFGDNYHFDIDNKP